MGLQEGKQRLAPGLGDAGQPEGAGADEQALAAGVDDIWLNQGLDLDGITVAALVAREVPRVVIGIAAVPMYPRHPVTLASQAKAAQPAAGGRFALGIGLGRKA